MFDKEIVCLGAGITSTDSRAIETIVENRKLTTSGGTNAFTVNGVAKSAATGWDETMTGVNWAHLAGPVAGSDIGYYFPEAATVHALREACTGAWYDVNTGGSTNPITRNYLTLWFDHGSNPDNATYQYVLLPGLASSNVAAYAAAPDVTVLANAAGSQGVRKASQGYTAVNFWSAGTLGGISADKPSSVIVRNDGTWLEVAVSDPTQTNTGPIAVEVDTAAVSVVSLDSGVSVTRMSPTVKLSVNATSADGRSYVASFFQGKMQAVALAPVADAYVENGSNATNNYGSSTSLVVKYNGGSTLTREAYLRFDLTSQTNGILAGADLRLTAVTCNGGDTQTVSAVSDHTWTESGLVWTNKPASGAELARWTVQPNVPFGVQAAVGSAAKAAVGGSLDLRVTALANAYVAYASREHATATNRPQLVLTYAHPPPEVALTAPAQGTSVHWTQGLTLTAVAAASGGSVTNVIFFDGGVELGCCVTPPYSLTVTNLAPGAHSFTAVAVENAGASATGTPVVVTVTGEPLARPGKALTLKDTPADVDLRFLGQAYATPSGELANDVPSALLPGQSLLLRETGDFNAARIRRQIGTNELSFSDHDWSFGGWFNRASQVNDDFIFYMGAGDGFGSQEEFHLYGAGSSTGLLLRHYIGANATDIDLNAGSVTLGE